MGWCHLCLQQLNTMSVMRVDHSSHNARDVVVLGDVWLGEMSNAASGSGGVPAISLVLSTYESETFMRCPRGMVLDVFRMRLQVERKCEVDR